MRTLLITGATGAIGSALVGQLLDDPDARLRLLVRAPSDGEASMRLESLLGFVGVGPEDAARRSRVQAVRGDVCTPSFGLDAARYARLAAECTQVIHAAGAVRMNLPLEAARHSAIASARNVFAFARLSEDPKKIEFVSTVGVGGRTDGEVPERWLTQPRRFHNTYEQAKAEAEELAQSEVERGLPLTVHRPSMVVGDSRTGAIIHHQVFYHLCEFLSGRRTGGLCPALGDARLDIVPVDFVARAIAWSGRAEATTGRIVHLCSGPGAVRVDDLQRAVRAAFAAAGRRLPPRLVLPPRAFLGIVNALSVFSGTRTRRAVSTLPVFLDYLRTRQSFANAQTQRLLAAAGIPVPAVDSYLANVLHAQIRPSPAAAGQG